MALAFGGIFNFLVRRFVGADEVEGYDLRQIKDNIRGRAIFFWTLAGGGGGGGGLAEKKVQ